MQKLKFTLFSLRDFLVAFGPVLALFCGLVYLGYRLADPAPSRLVDMTSGVQGSTYERFARAYSSELAKSGVTLRNANSEGSQQNFERIRDPDSVYEVGFVRSGSTDPEQAAEQGLISLGALFYEPIWIFYRSKTDWRSLTQLKGKRINLGARGSGIQRIFTELLQLNHLQEADVSIQRLPDQQALASFLRGETDVLVFCTGSDSEIVQQLLQNRDVRLFDFEQAEAYTRRLAYLSAVTLPRGIIDIGADLPARDYHLLATTVTLVAHESLHPALVSLMLQAARSIHSKADWFSKRNEFPSERFTEIPVSEHAVKFYEHGTPVLQRYLPFWVANFIERMWFVLVAAGALILPLSKIIPPVYVWRIRSRIYRWYGQLREIELSLEQEGLGWQQGTERLDALENSVNQIVVPLAYAEELYGLRGHIQLVRSRLAAAAARDRQSPPAESGSCTDC